MKNLFASFLLLFAMSASAQSLKKPFKALNEGQLVEAATGFEEYKLKDSLDPLLWFGFARLYSEPAYVRCDFFLAWKCILRSQQLLAALDEKGLKKLEGELNADSLNRWQKHIDDRLFEKVTAENTVAMYEKHLQLCSASTHNKEVIQQRNAKAFLDAKEKNTVIAYQEFIRDYPGAAEVSQARMLEKSAAARDALSVKTEASCETFLLDYPDAEEAQAVFDTLQELRLQFFLNNVSDSLYEVTCFNFYIADSGRYHLDPSLLVRAYDAIRFASSQQHWIYYLSGGNIYRMNEKDMKTEEVLMDGKIASFVINSKGDIVFLKETQPQLLTFYLFYGTKAEKLCDFPTKDRFSDFDPVVPTFEATSDFSYIYFSFGTMAEAGQTRNATYIRAEKKWIVCDVLEERPCKSPIDPNNLMQAGALISHAGPGQEETYLTKKVNGVWELFRKEKDRLIQISHTESFKVRETWGEEVNYFGYTESPKKVFYYFPQECGDFCYGPCFVANLDGSQQVLIDNSIWVGQVDVQWLYVSGDLLWIDESGNLIVYEGKENTIRLIASSVDQFRTVHIENSGE